MCAPALRAKPVGRSLNAGDHTMNEAMITRLSDESTGGGTES